MLRRSVLVFTVCVLGVFCASASASASVGVPGAGWELTASTVPAHISPGGTGLIYIDVYNIGAASSSGTVTVTDTLPEGLTATAASGPYNPRGFAAWGCSIEAGGKIVACTRTAPVPPGELQNEGGANEPADYLEVTVRAEAGAARTGSNVVRIEGGGAPVPASVTDQIVTSSALPGFGFAEYDGWASNADGTVDTQAGSHPYDFTISFELNTYNETPENAVKAPDDARNIAVSVPPGIVGNPTAVSQCPREVFDNYECPVRTQVGIDRANLGRGAGGLGVVTLPVYNLVPPTGMPAQFGFVIAGVHTFLDAGVRTGSDNGITERVRNVVETAGVSGNSITLWGIPAEASHDDERCRKQDILGCSGGIYGASSNAEPRPFLSLPTSCGTPPRFAIEANSWEEPDNVAKAEFLLHDSMDMPTGWTGCERLAHFGPEVAIAPDTSFSDTPAGLGVELKIPPDANPDGLGTAGVKDTTVTLPEGVSINPGQATGLQACQAWQENIGGGEAKREEEEGPPSCPTASKVGTDEIVSPLLGEHLKGNVYVLQQNPPNIGLLVVASAEGVNLKLVGTVHLNETTGRLVTTFENTPDLPFTIFKLNFSGGAQAALSTPTNCGTYGSEARFVPWSTPFVASTLFTSSFQILAGPGGSPCPSNPLPFSPSLIAGATTDQAGGFTHFSLLLQAPDGQQRISRLQFKAPPGLLGMISQVSLCEEPQAALGTCSVSSQIGHNIDAAGAGPYPFVVPQAGQPPNPIYLTGPYEGAPFGLTIVVPAIAGPFNLGTVVVRAKIEVDPLTAQITVTTDPLPQILDGIPLDLRTVDAVIDREGFMFNPTDCAPQSFSGTATSVQGATAPLASHFQVGSCQALKFDPDFRVAASGKNSRKSGASLNVKILYPIGKLPDNQATSQANVGQVKVDLPKQLPSRLTTLQKACTAAVFEANPATCPSESKVGFATAITPLLPVPVEGPAYFVSYGGAKFPELVIVLQGYGVTVYLHGETFISKTGITSSTFRHVPDVPITSFELNLPQGPYSALAANGNLCNTKLVMPTAFTGQNNAIIHQNTPIRITGCGKTKTKTSKHKRNKKAGKARKTSIHTGDRRTK
jgi:uncharacterized repeat protein (TIGR01451 family)